MKLATVILLFQIAVGVAIKSKTEDQSVISADGKSDIAVDAPKNNHIQYSVTIVNEKDIENTFTSELELDFNDVKKSMYPSVLKFLKECDITFTE